MALTVPPRPLLTYSRFPSAAARIVIGLEPSGIVMVPVTFFVATSITETLPPASLAE